MTAYGLMRTSFVTLVLTAGVPERDVMIGPPYVGARTAHYDRLHGQVERAVGPRPEA